MGLTKAQEDRHMLTGNGPVELTRWSEFEGMRRLVLCALGKDKMCMVAERVHEDEAGVHSWERLSVLELDDLWLRLLPTLISGARCQRGTCDAALSVPVRLEGT